ncbi:MULTISPECIES: Hcp family type VI secretion system effector [Mesorhizobium]|uniref:Hcp1 family type VI secretion system effector n=1 Tax=Mesorhizobium loti R88b TaxID=935548 RepID=A0A6M7X190_RHILI|nr:MULTISPECIES: Hcp family type VI secretion system effector [Mesorhizobium]TGU40241.1 Hcp1 family type VI secretion system effector [bacterium M00.F.Ca.ET.156.01.1.1]TGV14969.1 Hcp1 family type VI secretion system effector [Mesorhizobium sp. M8A.F.Ca.ET.173.01.1.1]QKD05221.1 Hcp1 family type VI secretion system effector [Mesorhizobium loti R88b]TGQ77081.1 Hcp1 family type VI secretion system effector [Mesorhizobium sp. M8A.F.Ca.ET.207.01.1.1]TGQ89260.1 Hcp1 family type VI secretion system ef
MPTTMKIDGFLKVPDIKGPSTRDGHSDEIEVHGVDYKMVAPYDPNSLSRRGRVSMGMIKFTKHYDKSSPYLAKALFENKALNEVVFSARRTIDGESKDYLVVTLTDASIMEYDMSQADDEADLIEEAVSFAYKKIKFVYDGNDEAEMDVYVGK